MHKYQWFKNKPIEICFVFFLILSNSCCVSQNYSQENEIISESHSTNVTELNITTLSTMLANQGIGEWGYAALIEVDGKKILFDTGRFPETVLNNAKDLGIELSDIEDVFLSHNHGDHTGGLITLRNELKKSNPNALSRIHVGKGIFNQRVNARNRMLEIKMELEADGVEFIVYDSVAELFPGVWITGPIPRVHNEKNYGGNGKIVTDNGVVEDNIPEDQSLILDTEKGFVLVAGCGHAGMINTLDYIQEVIHKEKIHAAIGGFHLLTATDEHLKWTADKLRGHGLDMIIGAHCTGINALYTIKELLQFDRAHAVVGSVGDQFDLINGIRATVIAR